MSRTPLGRGCGIMAGMPEQIESNGHAGSDAAELLAAELAGESDPAQLPATERPEFVLSGQESVPAAPGS